MKKGHKLFGIGTNDYNGLIYSKINKKHIKSYTQWKSMLQRCYDEKYIYRYKTYIDCTVCEEWLLFTNFKEWHDENYIDGYQLDKDILVKGNKVYSPQTCCFVPEEINKLFTKSNSIRGKSPIGVSYNKESNMFQSNIMIFRKKKYLGRFKDKIEAFNAYKEAKENQVKSMAIKYYSNGLISLNVYNSMIKYKVSITD